MKIRLPKSRRLRWAIYLSTPPILFLLYCLGMRWYTFRESAAELRIETERLDAEEPGWDWDSYLKNRAPVRDEENSYDIIAKALLLPSLGAASYDPEYNLWLVAPEPMPIEVAEWAGEFVADRNDAILLVRQLRRFPNGRHPLAYTPGLIDTPLTSIKRIYRISHLLQWDIRVNAQLGRFDACIEDLRAMQNAARSVGDEAEVIPHFVRIGTEMIVVKSISEMLAQGEAPVAGLAILQGELAAEGRQPHLEHALRTVRASTLKIMQNASDGDGTTAEGLFRASRLLGLSPPTRSIREDFRWRVLGMRYAPIAEADQAHMLRQMNQMIEIARSPGPERLVRSERFDAEQSAIYRPEGDLLPNPHNFLTKRLIPVSFIVIRSDLRWKAAMRSAATGLAAERFRLVHKRWPNSLGELIPQFHDRVEEDPFTAKPLIFKKFEDGIAIYSIGENGIDDGGDVNGKTQTEGRARGDYKYTLPTDVGIRLWDVEKRGRFLR